MFPVIHICKYWITTEEHGQRLQPSRILRRVVSWKLTDFTEELTVSIIRVIITSMTEGANTSEISINFYEITRHSISEGCHLYIHLAKFKCSFKEFCGDKYSPACAV
jgi:hypothetical protein